MMFDLQHNHWKAIVCLAGVSQTHIMSDLMGSYVFICFTCTKCLALSSTCLACRVEGEGAMNWVAAKTFQSNIRSNNSKYDVGHFNTKVFVNCRLQGPPLSTLYYAVTKTHVPKRRASYFELLQCMLLWNDFAVHLERT